MKKIMKLLSITLSIGVITTLSACGEEPTGSIEIITPEDNKTSLNLRPLISWESSEEEVVVTIATDEEFKNIVVEEKVKNHFYQVTTELKKFTKYYLKVSSGKIQDIISFTTEEGTFEFADVFKSNMVLQRNKEVSIWGNGTPNLDYTLEFNGQTIESKSDDNGNVSFLLNDMDSNLIGQNLIVRSNNQSVKLENVVIGEVIVVSGQSNMAWATGNNLQDDISDEIKLADEGNIRLMTNTPHQSDSPEEDFKSSSWLVATQGLAKSFSAIGYLTGANLYESLNKEVPIGLISASQGETNIMSWISEDFDLSNHTITVGTPHSNFNAMINPMRGLTIGSVVWYQGEENSKNFGSYEELLEIFIKDWRNVFNDKDLDIFVVQLPLWGVLESNQWPFIREAQFNVTSKDEKAHLIVTMDGGDYYDVHPTTKKYIALRLNDYMMYKMFNGNKVEYTYWDQNEVNTTNNTLEVTFTSNIKVLNNENIKGFEIAGDDMNYLPANAVINGNKVLLSNDLINSPKYVKYNFAGASEGNLINEYNLPVGPFRNEYSTVIMLDDFNRYENIDEMVGTGWDNGATPNSYKWSTSNTTVDLIDGNVLLTPTKNTSQFTKILNGNYKFYKSLTIKFKTEESFNVSLSSGSSSSFVKVEGSSEWQTINIPLTDFSKFENYVWSMTITPNTSPLTIDYICITNNE